jgi:hypothetical protein
MKSSIIRLIAFAALCLPAWTGAAVAVEETKPSNKPPLAQAPGQSRSIDPSTVEMPRNDKRPLGTAITGTNSATPIARHGDGPLSMKCWQDGKLIIDQPVKSLPPDAQRRSTMINAHSGTDVYAFDFKNAMCIIK